MKKGLKKGFTLIELLLVIVIIAILSVAVLFALNPQKRIQDSQKDRRLADVDTILGAIHSSIIDSNGKTPSAFDTAINAISAGGGAQTPDMMLGTNTAAGCVTLGIPSGAGVTSPCSVTANAACYNILAGTNNVAAYLQSYPQDPTGFAGSTQAVSQSMTGYAVQVTNNGTANSASYLFTVKACGSPSGVNAITISR